MSDAQLEEPVLHSIIGSSVTLDRAVMHGATLIKADLQDSSLIEAQLHRAECRRLHLGNCSLSRAQLVEADFTYARLSQVDPRRANLRGASFVHARLGRCRVYGLRGTPGDVTGATYGLTDFSPDADGSDVTHLAPWSRAQP